VCGVPAEGDHSLGVFNDLRWHTYRRNAFARVELFDGLETATRPAESCDVIEQAAHMGHPDQRAVILTRE
jgi:hypothetical protein